MPLFPSPRRDIQHESLKGVHSHWRHSFSFVNNHYLFLACFLIVLLSIMLYLLRLRRIHRRTAQRCSPSSVQWLEEGLGSPTLPINLWTLESVKSKQLGGTPQTTRERLEAWPSSKETPKMFLSLLSGRRTVRWYSVSSPDSLSSCFFF